jgi:hypothetical protein
MLSTAGSRDWSRWPGIWVDCGLPSGALREVVENRVGPMKHLLRRLCLIEAVLTASSDAAPSVASVTSVTKVEAPNWWVHHAGSPIQAPLTGAGLMIYPIVPDRFANCGPPNDSPLKFGRPPGRTVAGATHGGDVRGARNHPASLKAPGVTGVRMTPMYRNSLPGVSSYHGYSSVDFYAVERRFGTMQDIGDLPDSAHAMALIVQDQVSHHNCPRHPFVADFGAAVHRRVAGYTPHGEEESLSPRDHGAAAPFRNIRIRSSVLTTGTERRIDA